MNIDLFGQCTTCEVDFSKVPEIIKQQIEYELGTKITCDNYIITITKSIADKYHIPYDAICKVSYKKDIYKIESLLSQFIFYSNNFLVFSEKPLWNGYPGYYFCNSLLETVERPMETQIFIKEAAKNAIKCYEVPYNTIEGTTTYIVGLTAEEFGDLYTKDYMDLENFIKNIFS